MSRYIELYSLPASLYLKDTPVLISGGRLLIGKHNGKYYVRLNMSGVDDRAVSSVTVKILPFDTMHEAYEKSVEYTYEKLKVERDDVFGEKDLIEMPDEKVRSFKVIISEVAFADGNVWHNETEFEEISGAKRLEDALGSESMARQYAARYGNDCVYLPSENKDMWFCTCGAANRMEEERCHSCHRKRTALEAINLDSLRTEAKKSEEAEKREEAELQAENEKKRKRLGKVLKISLIVLPLLLVVILVAATVPPYFERHNAYDKAVTLLNNNQFDEAEAVFEELGSFLDSAEQAASGVPYARACYLFNCAEKADAAAAENAGISREELKESEDVSMLLYTKADALFTELGSYKDCEAKRAEIAEVFSEYEYQKILDAYNAASALLENGSYLAARNAFVTLGETLNAGEMTKECIYKRADAMLNFCEHNNIRNISISVSRETGKNTVISMPGAVLTRLGSNVIYELKMFFYNDGVEFLYEDEPSVEGCIPICEAAALEFESLGEYKDCSEKAERARAAGDFTSEFFDLLRDGDLKAALNWLETFSDPFDEREKYPEWIENCLEFVDEWVLYQGYSGIIPYSAGIPDTQLINFKSSVSIEEDTVTLVIYDPDTDFSVELKGELGGSEFKKYADDGSVFYALLNQVNHLTYIWYTADGTVLSSCEYEIA